jgi:hypothetical protein
VTDGPIAGGGSLQTSGSSPSSAIDGSNNSTTSASASASASGASNAGGHSTTIIIGAVVAGVVVLAIITGLVAYICLLRRRNATKTAAATGTGGKLDPNNPFSDAAAAGASGTELHKLTPPSAPVTPSPGQGQNAWAGKVELPTGFNGYTHYELPVGTPAPQHAQMSNMPNGYELPAGSPAPQHAQMSNMQNNYELPVGSPALQHAQMSNTNSMPMNMYNQQARPSGEYYNQPPPGHQPSPQLSAVSGWNTPVNGYSPYGPPGHPHGPPHGATPGVSPVAGSAVPMELPANSGPNRWGTGYQELPG